MPTLAYNTEQVLKILSELPSEKVDEVMDFAEYLKQKACRKDGIKPSSVALPLYHLGRVDPQVFERSSLYGDRIDSHID